MKYDTATPYAAVGLVFRRAEKIAFVLRSNTDWMNGHYSLPGGKVEKGENFTDAAIREAEEEVGVKLKPENLEHILTCQRQHSDTDWVDIVFEAKDWHGKLHNAEPDIHGELAWFGPDNLPKNMVPHIYVYIKNIQAGNNYVEYS